MPVSALSAPLRGIVPPMVTPLCDDDTLNVDGLERLIEHILSGGVHGLFILGINCSKSQIHSRLKTSLPNNR
jgi:4-hydroxy-tetrahydrodipicolinate synthase